jgi:hypothetical protein
VRDLAGKKETKQYNDMNRVVNNKIGARPAKGGRRKERTIGHGGSVSDRYTDRLGHMDAVELI